LSVKLSPDSKTSLTTEALDSRINFHDLEEILDIDLRGLTLENSADANALYDRLERRIADTGQELWFFLINYGDTKIDPAAWFAFSRRGKELNLAHSMGSVRFDASPETRTQIERDAGTEKFDPNLFANRDDALAKLGGLPSKRVAKIAHTPNYSRDDFLSRIKFLDDQDIMDVDFTDLVLEHSRDVNDCYDVIDELIAATGRKWFFLVNYEGTKIYSAAWIQYSARGKALNEAWSLGSVRYAPGSETETDIRLRAETGGFRPNIRNTRDEALERIDELKAESTAD